MYNTRKVEKSEIYSYEREEKTLPLVYERQLKANKAAYNYFNEMAPSRRKISIGWIMSGKKEETRNRRFETLLNSCVNGELIPQLRWSKEN